MSYIEKMRITHNDRLNAIDGIEPIDPDSDNYLGNEYDPYINKLFILKPADRVFQAIPTAIAYCYLYQLAQRGNLSLSYANADLIRYMLSIGYDPASIDDAQFSLNLIPF